MANGPKPTFYIAVLVVVIGLVGLALWRFGAIGPKSGAGLFSTDEISQMAGGAEKPDSSGITTVKEYNYVPSARLPEVKGISNYQPLADRTVRFAINVWAGWSPIIYANGGFKPGKLWKTPGGRDFKVELVLVDDPVAMRDAYAAGTLHIGWATLDMLPLMLEGLRTDSRVMPRVFQQVDWSNGGDGIVVREGIKSMADLRKKKIALAENSPSHFFILNALLNAGIQPHEVDFQFTADAFQAAAAFNKEKDIAACVSWAPDIYKLTEPPAKNKLLVSTGTANKLIADVWYARADFAKDHPEIIEGLVRGIFDAMIELKQPDDATKQKLAKLMADAYNIPATETADMLQDAHSTNYAENREFFLNANNPTNFERTYNMAYFLYSQVTDKDGQRYVKSKVPFDQVMDFSVLKKLSKEDKYASQKDEYTVRFTPAAASKVQAESGEILTKTVVIHFFPNSWDVHKKVTKMVDGKEKEVLYDPNADLVLEEIAKLAGQYGAARIVIEGHTDSSMKGRAPEDLVLELSGNRANGVKEALVNKFKSLQPDQFSTKGAGWSRPADPDDPNNHARNRRVEIKVYPAEAQ